MTNTQIVNIVAIDIGVKNLAICRLRLINLPSAEDTPHKACNKPILQIKYWNVINIMENTKYESKSSRSISVESINSALTQKFWELIPVLASEKIDHVIIERQMNTTEMAYYAYALQSLFYTCMNQPSLEYSIGTFAFQNAGKKFQLAKLWPDVNFEQVKKYELETLNKMINELENREAIKDGMDKIADYAGIKYMGVYREAPTKFKKMRETKTQSSYVYNKKLSVVITKMLLIYYNLEENEQYLETVKNKKDDLCDAFNIGYFELVERGYIKNHKYILKKNKKRKRA